MQEFTIKKGFIIERTKLGYKIGLTDIIGTANSFKDFVEINKHDLKYTDLNGADLQGVDLSNADLRHADLFSANLSGCNLLGSNLSFAYLAYTDLSEHNIIHKKIYRYKFIKTSKDFNKCLLIINSKTNKIKDWNYFFSDECQEVYETPRNSEKFQEIKKEYEEAINEFKNKFDNGEI